MIHEDFDLKQPFSRQERMIEMEAKIFDLYSEVIALQGTAIQLSSALEELTRENLQPKIAKLRSKGMIWMGATTVDGLLVCPACSRKTKTK